MAQTTSQAKLCPHCANSIALDALKCPYCKAPLNPEKAPEWAERSSDGASESRVRPSERRGIQPKLVAAAAAIVLVALVAVFALSYWPRGKPGATTASAELREREQKINTLEAELAKLRENNQGSATELQELKSKLSETQKDLAAAEKKLANANREIERLQSSRTVSNPRRLSRSADPAPRSGPAPRSDPAPPVTRSAEPGLYETLRSTRVFEEPVGSSRVLTEIARGTQVTVVRSTGEWLEVRSKHGNPPGFIRADDARFVARAN